MIIDVLLPSISPICTEYGSEQSINPYGVGSRYCISVLVDPIQMIESDMYQLRLVLRKHKK